MDFITNVLKTIAPKVALKRMRTIEAIRRYEGAGGGYRWDGFNASEASTNFNNEVFRDIASLKKRSRHLYQNDPYSKRIPHLIANNVVGSGIVATVKTSNGTNARTADLQAKWESFATNKNIDFNERNDFYSLTHLCLRSVVVDGEVFVVRRRVPTKYNEYGIQIQVLESDFLDTTKYQSNLPNGEGYIWYGVQFNKFDKVEGYWLYDKHPNEADAKSNFFKKEDVCHVFLTERPGQLRGVPWSASTLLKQRDLGDYEDAELYGKKATATITAIVTNTSPDSITNDGTKPADDRFDSFTPGTVNYMKPGESIQFPQLPQNYQYPAYISTQYRAIAAGIGVTYETLTGDLSNVNFSSGRMGWIEMHRNIEVWQWQLIIPQFCDVVFNWFVDQLKMLVVIPSTTAVTVGWTPPRREMIDPLKEINAIIKQLRSSLISFPEAVKQLGYDPKEIVSENALYKKLFEDNGIVADWNIEFDAQYLMAKTSAKQAAQAKPAPPANS